ncbi:MerR family transcriptional regulator [Kineosporia mesophila]|uniref:MerR family transcriptional regulator n=1 Tax=Kineosporia mesophila TaxID=566012 RepID=A0ABP7AJ22_9ACTN|nr:MerR family transcriptional regulator [Kineosporia mesophila]
MFRIGDLAAQAGVSTRALRYYEEKGLLAAVRSTSGQRYYPESATERVRTIQHLYSAGLFSQGVATLLPCVDAQETSPEALAVLRTERERIDQQIRDLTATRNRLDEVIVIATVPGHCAAAPEVAPHATSR